MAKRYKHNKFCLKAALNRLGIQSNSRELITRLVETNVGYKPTELLSVGKLKDLEFHQLSVDLLVGAHPLLATGKIKYEGNKVKSEVNIVKGNATLLHDFLRSIF